MFSRKRIFGYRFIAFASMSIAILGFFVWGHHMFLSSESVYAGIVFSFLSFVIAVPSAIKVFNWTATLYKGSITFHTPMLYALGFIGLFTIGGMTGLFVAALATDVHLHDTYFVVAHFHYIMVGGMVLAFMGGLHFWWPKITGRMYPEPLGQLAALVTFIGFNLTFFPQFILGYLGMPRRYHAYPPEFQVWNVLSTAGASILAVGYHPAGGSICSGRCGTAKKRATIPGTRPAWNGRRPRRRRRIISRKRPSSPPSLTLIRWPSPPSNWRKNPPMPDVHFARPPSIPRRPAPAREEQFDDLDQQTEAAHLGMWLFSGDGNSFLRRVVRGVHRLPFQLSARVRGGQPRTALGGRARWIRPSCLCSSFVDGHGGARGADGARRLLAFLLLLGAAIIGAGFWCCTASNTLPITGITISREVFPLRRPAPDNKVQLFFTLYFCMTGLHSLHVAHRRDGADGAVAWQAWRGKYSKEYYTPVEVGGLYWHFVDIVWVFLFPLLYLVAH